MGDSSSEDMGDTCPAHMGDSFPDSDLVSSVFLNSLLASVDTPNPGRSRAIDATGADAVGDVESGGAGCVGGEIMRGG